MLSVGLHYHKAAALPPRYHQPPGTPGIIVPIAVRRYTDSVSVIPTWVLHPRRDRHIGPVTGGGSVRRPLENSSM